MATASKGRGKGAGAARSPTEPRAKTPPRIKILRDWCKGCRICVEFCPREVLAMEGQVAVVVNLEACTRCGLCEQLCPDFAIEVE